MIRIFSNMYCFNIFPRQPPLNMFYPQKLVFRSMGEYKKPHALIVLLFVVVFKAWRNSRRDVYCLAFERVESLLFRKKNVSFLILIWLFVSIQQHFNPPLFSETTKCVFLANNKSSFLLDNNQFYEYLIASGHEYLYHATHMIGVKTCHW